MTIGRQWYCLIYDMEIKIFDESLSKFIQSLEKSTIAKILRTIDLLEMFGYKLGPPHSRKVSDNLLELRIRGKQEVRIFYTFYKNKIVLLHGFIKKSQRIPKREIQVAIEKLKNIDSP